MGRVPDRGGRPCEIEPPPPEMPSWQKRQDAPQSGGHYGGSGHGGSRGGYDHYSQGGRGGYERGGGSGGGRSDRGGRGGGARGGKLQGGWGGGGGGGRGGENQSHVPDAGGQQGGRGTGRVSGGRQGVRSEPEGEVGTEELGTMKELSRNLASMEEEEVTMTVTTKMGAGIRRGEGVEEVGVAGEEVVEEEEDKEEAGEGEGGILLTKADSLNSSSNMAGNTTAKLALIKADTTLAEDRLWGIAAESTQRRYML